MIYTILIIILISYLSVSLYDETKVRKEVEEKNKLLESTIVSYSLEIDYLRNIANNRLKNIRLKTNEEILDAVKYARKHSPLIMAEMRKIFINFVTSMKN